MSNVLIISEVPTHPTNAGNRNCILSYSKMLRGLGHEVFFLFYSGYGFDESDIRVTKEHWGSRFYHYKCGIKFYLKRRFFYYYRTKVLRTKVYDIDDFYPDGLEERVTEIVQENKITSIITNYVWTSKVFKSLHNVKKVLYTHDMFTERQSLTGMNFFSTSRRQEALALERADVVISIQEKESEFFRKISTKPILTGFSPSDQYILPLSFTKDILFFAGANELNIQGICYFIKEVLPLLIKKDSSLRLLIGGGICKKLKVDGNSSVKLVGGFENPKDFYELGDIVINPVRSGTGLKIKTIEALSFGKIVVSLEHGVEGLFDQINAPVRVVESDIEFAETILGLLNNEEKLRHLYSAGQTYIREYNSYVESVFEEAIKIE